MSPVGGHRWKMFVEEPRTAKGRGVGVGVGWRKLLLSSNDRKQEKPQGTKNGINLLVAIKGDGKVKLTKSISRFPLESKFILFHMAPAKEGDSSFCSVWSSV